MFTHLKICGITNLQDALETVRLGVTFLGFNFFEQSPRYIAPNKAREIISQLPPMTNTVGILVKPTLQRCQQIIEQTKVKFLQIYDPLDFGDFSQLPVPVIASYRLRDRDQFIYKNRHEQYVLLDAFHTGAYGGTGQKLNWVRLPQSVPRERLILAGGINPDNILDALNTVNPAVIDVASGAERAPGKKDIEKIKALQKAVLTFNVLKMNSLQHWLLK